MTAPLLVDTFGGMLVPWAVERIPPGVAGTVETVRRMATLARERSLHPYVRRAAVSIVRFLPGRDAALQARYIRDWLDDRAQFLPDPTLAEALHDPLEMLAEIDKRGITRVDCDDVAVLAATLGLAIGLRPRFQVAAFSPNRRYSHVWTEFVTAAGVVVVDPTRPVAMPRTTKLMTVPLW